MFCSFEWSSLCSWSCPQPVWMTLRENWTRASWSWCWPMAKYKGKSQRVHCTHPYCSLVVLCHHASLTVPSPLGCSFLVVSASVSHRKKGGRAASSNGDGRVSKFQPLLPSSALSDLDSEDELQIDESPPPRRRAPPNKKKLGGEVLHPASCVPLSWFAVKTACCTWNVFLSWILLENSWNACKVYIKQVFVFRFVHLNHFCNEGSQITADPLILGISSSLACRSEKPYY